MRCFIFANDLIFQLCYMTETIYQRFKELVQLYPDSPAIIDSNRRLTYAQLDRMVDAVALPDCANRRIGIVMEHGAEMIAAIFAVLKGGGTYVPVEPTFPHERIKFILNEAGVSAVITDNNFSTNAQGHIDPKARPDTPAYILYTSGTTGKPKGVVVTNRNVCHYARAFEHEFNIVPGDVMAQLSVCTFDIFVEEVFATLLNGACLFIPTEEDKADIGHLMNAVMANNVTIISGFPYLLLDINKLPVLPPTLRLLISGGDVLRAAYINNLVDKVDIYNTYGPSETTVCASYFRCNGATPLADGTYPIGKAVRGVTIEILDDDLNPVAQGQTGEICIFGDGISNGYLTANPESSNFTNMSDGRRVYRTGDLGYMLPDGNIAFLHRKDHQVMIRGKRVECEEVENVLCACPEVEQGVVAAFTDSVGLSYLVAYIVPKIKSISLSGIRHRLSRFLTPFMIPEFFVELKTFPLTPNGKVDRDALPVILKEGRL